jgi:hypothetical protein
LVQANYNIRVIEKGGWLWVRFKIKYWTWVRACHSSIRIRNLKRRDFESWSSYLRVSKERGILFTIVGIVLWKAYMRERERECVCVCVWERERERERESVCVCERERERECVCVCVWEREREIVNVMLLVWRPWRASVCSFIEMVFHHVHASALESI